MTEVSITANKEPQPQLTEVDKICIKFGNRVRDTFERIFETGKNKTMHSRTSVKAWFTLMKANEGENFDKIVWSVLRDPHSDIAPYKDGLLTFYITA